MEDYNSPITEQTGMPQAIVSNEELEEVRNRISKSFGEFGIDINKINVTKGPNVSFWEIYPETGVKVSKIRNIKDDIILSLGILGCRIICPIPGRGTIGIEIPNKQKQIVPFRAVLSTPDFMESKMELPVALGQDIEGKPFILDLTKTPHILIAGATGMGKSMALHSIIASLISKNKPEDLKLVLIDPKKSEFMSYAYLKPFIAKTPGVEQAINTDINDILSTLESLCELMDQRYNLLKKTGARNIKEYNQMRQNGILNSEEYERMPYIVGIIDEFGDLIMSAGKAFELPLCRIAQLARAVGIHMIISTQRPTCNIITGIIKVNFPCQIACKVVSKQNSLIILNTSGAECLTGPGDMLVLSGNGPVRIQGAYIDEYKEIPALCEKIIGQTGNTEDYILPIMQTPANEQEPSDLKIGTVKFEYEDSLFEDAARYVVSSREGSTSMLQRHFCIGYNRAGRLMDLLELAGIVGQADGRNARKILIDDIISLSSHLSQLKCDIIETELNSQTEQQRSIEKKQNQPDDTTMKVARFVVDNQIASISFIQRAFRMGFNQAGLIVDELEKLGIIGPSRGTEPRVVYVKSIEELERMFIN